MTIRKVTAAAILALTIPAAFTAAAQDSIHWKDVGDWTISIDPTLGNGCYATASWQSGTELRIGRDPEADNFYMLLGVDLGIWLEAEQTYELGIKFDRRASWDVNMRGMQFNPGERVFLIAQSKKNIFIREFQRSLKMKISYRGRAIDTLSLTGSSRAWNEVEVCQKAMLQTGMLPVQRPAGVVSTGPNSGTGKGGIVP